MANRRLGIEFESKGSTRLAAEIKKLNSSLKQTSKSFQAFGRMAKGALGAVIGIKVIGNLAKFQKSLFDISRTSKLTFQSFSQLKKTIDDVGKSTTLSRDQVASFIKTVQDQTKGAQLSAKAMGDLAKTLSREFGPAIENVQDALKDLMAIQQKEVNVLRMLDKGMDPKTVREYAAALVLTDRVSDKQLRTFLRTAEAHRRQGKQLTEEEKKLIAYNRSVEKIQSSWKNFQLEIAGPVAEALTKLEPIFTKLIKGLTGLVEKSGQFQKALSFVPMIAGATALITALTKIKGLVTGPMGILLAGGVGAAGARTRARAGGTRAGGTGAAAMAAIGGLGPSGRSRRVRESAMGFMGGFGRERGIIGARRGRWLRDIPTRIGAGVTGLGRTTARMPGMAGRGMLGFARKGLAGGLAGGAMALGGQVLGQGLRQAGQERAGAGVSALGAVGGGAVTGAAMGSIIGPWGTAIGGVVGAIGGLTTQLDSLKKAFPELGGIFKILETHLAGLKKEFQPLIQQAIKMAEAAIEPLMESLKDILPPLIEIGVTIGKILAKSLLIVMKVLTPIIKLLSIGLATALKVIGPILSFVTGLIEELADGISVLADALGSFLGSIADEVSSLFGIGGGAKAPGAGMADKITSAIKEFSKKDKAKAEEAGKAPTGIAKAEEAGKAPTGIAALNKAQLAQLEKIEKTMGASRDDKKGFMKAAAGFYAMRDFLRKQGRTEKEIPGMIAAMQSGRFMGNRKLLAGAMGAQRGGPSMDVGVAQAGTTFGKFAPDITAKYMKETMSSGHQTVIALKNAQVVAEQIVASLQKAVDANVKIAQVQSRYRGNLEGALGTLEQNKTLYDAQYAALKNVEEYSSIINDKSTTQVQKMQEIRDILQSRGSSEREISQTLTFVTMQLEGQLDLQGKMAAIETGRAGVIHQQLAEIQEYADLQGSQVGLLESQIALTKSLYLGLGPTLDVQIKTVNAIETQIALVDKQIKLAKAAAKERPNDIKVQKALIGLQKTKTDLVRKELDITKNLREGYLDAMQAFTNVSGFFSKIILKREQGMGALIRQFGAAGGLRTGQVGAGGAGPIARWTQGGRLLTQTSQEWHRRAQTYGEQMLPVPGAVNVAAAAEGGGMGGFFRTREMQSGTGLAPQGQQPQGAGVMDIFQQAIQRNQRGGRMTGFEAANLQSRMTKNVEREKVLRKQIEQEPQNAKLQKQIGEVQSERKKIVAEARGPQAMSMGECCDKLLSKLDEIKAVLVTVTKISGAGVRATPVVAGGAAAVGPTPGEGETAKVVDAAAAEEGGISSGFSKKQLATWKQEAKDRKRLKEEERAAVRRERAAELGMSVADLSSPEKVKEKLAELRTRRGNLELPMRTTGRMRRQQEEGQRLNVRANAMGGLFGAIPALPSISAIGKAYSSYVGGIGTREAEDVSTGVRSRYQRRQGEIEANKKLEYYLERIVEQEDEAFKQRERHNYKRISQKMAEAEKQAKSATEVAKSTDKKQKADKLEKERQRFEPEKFRSSVQMQYEAMAEELKARQAEWSKYFEAQSTDSIMRGVNTSGVNIGRRGRGGGVTGVGTAGGRGVVDATAERRLDERIERMRERFGGEQGAAARGRPISGRLRRMAIYNEQQGIDQGGADTGDAGINRVGRASYAQVMRDRRLARARDLGGEGGLRRIGVPGGHDYASEQEIGKAKLREAQRGRLRRMAIYNEQQGIDQGGADTGDAGINRVGRASYAQVMRDRRLARARDLGGEGGLRRIGVPGGHDYASEQEIGKAKLREAQRGIFVSDPATMELVKQGKKNHTDQFELWKKSVAGQEHAVDMQMKQLNATQRGAKATEALKKQGEKSEADRSKLGVDMAGRGDKFATEVAIVSQIRRVAARGASGGWVGGPAGIDNVPAMLTAGEYVVNASSARKNSGLLGQINGYAAGGSVVPPLSMAGGGGGFSPKFNINVRGDSAHMIMGSVQHQLGSLLESMLAPTGTTGRFHDIPQSG